jgi:hypothetical protein
MDDAASLLMLDTGAGAAHEAVPKRRGQSVLQVAKEHWAEYLMESAELGLFMVSACVVTTLLYHPHSPVLHWVGNPFVRMALTGLAMAATLLLLIHSPWGKQSGAHMNPAMTLMFFRLHKIELWDAVFYMIFQFLGGLAEYCFRLYSSARRSLITTSILPLRSLVAPELPWRFSRSS